IRGDVVPVLADRGGLTAYLLGRSSRSTTTTRKLATITAITTPLMMNRTRRRTRRRVSFPIGLTQAGCERGGVATASSVMPHHIQTAKRNLRPPVLEPSMTPGMGRPGGVPTPGTVRGRRGDPAISR